jgi:hypothetical protein
MWSVMAGEKECSDFKDRSRFVELPCNVGDTVYRKDGAWNVVGFDCNRGGGWSVKLERWKDQFRDYHESTRAVFKSFGKTVFLTREEAEPALAERKTSNEN